MRLDLSGLLKAKNITQRELARLSGIRPSTVCDLCNQNARYIKLEHITKICGILVCEPNGLFEI